ncbi:MAG TPA: hypothetical protein VE641_15930 [Chthoniobacterales bacterium]|jgi:hypothetical protein|nr:hypothetical protein [Chthoniobacterales bacterium]
MLERETHHRLRLSDVFEPLPRKQTEDHNTERAQRAQRTGAVRFLPHREWLRSASKLTAFVLLGILISVAEIGCTHYNTVEPLSGSSLSQIVSPTGQTLCTGRWSSAGPEGPWDFYESNGNRTATIIFSQGAPAGQLRFYWGSLVVPSAAGKLQVMGTVRDGKFEQRWIRYATNGSVMNETIYWNDEMMTTRSYSSEGVELPPATAIARARLLDYADRRLLRSLLLIVRHAKPRGS